MINHPRLEDEDELEPGEVETVDEEFDDVDNRDLNFPVPEDY